MRTRAWARGPGLTDPVWLIGIPALGVALAALLVRGLGGPEAPNGGDTMAHLVRTDFGLREVFGRGHLDGWSPTPGVGSEIFLFYGPGLALFTLALRVASFGLLSTMGAFKAVVILSFLALPLAVSYLARGFGLTLRASGLAGILALGVSSVYGPGIEGMFGYGLVPHQVAAPIVVLGLGIVVRAVFDPRPRLMLPLAVCLAALVLVHLISAVIFVALSAVVVGLVALPRLVSAATSSLASRRSPRQLTLPGLQGFGLHRERGRDIALILGGAGALTFGLTAFWLVPFLGHRDLQGALTGWATPSFGFRLGEVFDGRLLFRPSVALFVLAGMVVAVLTHPNRRMVVLVLTPFVYLFLGHQFVLHHPYNEVALQLPHRGLGYAGLIAVIPLAAVIDYLTRRMNREGGDAVAVVLVVLIGVWPMVPLRPMTNSAVPRQAMLEAAGQIRRVVPATARFAVERQPDEARNTGVGSPPFWLAFASGRPVVNAFAPETSTAAGSMYVGDNMTQIEPDLAADRLVRFGVTHVFLTSSDSASRFRSSTRYTEIWTSPPLSLLEVLPVPDHPRPSSLVSTEGPAVATLDRGDPEHLRIRIDAPAPVTATLAVAWSPKWSVRLDGHPVELRRASDDLLEVSVPDGTHTVAADFRRDRWDVVGMLITSTALLGGAGVIWLRVRRRRHPATGAAPETRQDLPR